MSPVEIAYRLWRAVQARLQQSGLVGVRSVPPPESSHRSTPFRGQAIKVDPVPYLTAADAVAEGRLTVFSREHLELGNPPRWNRDPLTGIEAQLSFGKTLDYRNVELVGDIKYLWEPNRHLHLVTLGQAFALSGSRRYLRVLATHLTSWFDQCPHLRGPNWTSSLELAIRLINWACSWELIGGFQSPLFDHTAGRELRQRWLTSIYQHGHFIRGHYSRFSSANNHLIGEAAGLFVAAVTWPYWPVTEAWRESAFRELVREALQQNAPDGVNREQSTAYQQFVLDLLIVAALVGRRTGVEFPQPYWNRVEAMLEFIASIMDVGGNVPMIGDADDGCVLRLSQEEDFCPYRSLLATGAVLFGRGDFKSKARDIDDKTRWLLGDEAVGVFDDLAVPNHGGLFRRAFPAGGYYVMGADLETQQEIRLIVDAGPLGYGSMAAHGHADALAFTLSVSGREFLIDPGTFTYYTDTRWREYFRGSAAHNTVRLDGQSQSVSGGNFLWTFKGDARCEVWETDQRSDRLVGSHSGYERFPVPIRHRREVRLDKADRRVTITDTLECEGSHVVELFGHFSEACRVSLIGSKVVATNGDASIEITVPLDELDVQVLRGDEERPAGWVSRAFGRKMPSTTVVWCAEIERTTQITTSIECQTRSKTFREHAERSDD